MHACSTVDHRVAGLLPAKALPKTKVCACTDLLYRMCYAHTYTHTHTQTHTIGLSCINCLVGPSPAFATDPGLRKAASRAGKRRWHCSSSSSSSSSVNGTNRRRGVNVSWAANTCEYVCECVHARMCECACFMCTCFFICAGMKALHPCHLCISLTRGLQLLVFLRRSLVHTIDHVQSGNFLTYTRTHTLSHTHTQTHTHKHTHTQTHTHTLTHTIAHRLLCFHKHTHAHQTPNFNTTGLLPSHHRLHSPPLHPYHPSSQQRRLNR